MPQDPLCSALGRRTSIMVFAAAQPPAGGPHCLWRLVRWKGTSLLLHAVEWGPMQRGLQHQLNPPAAASTSGAWGPLAAAGAADPPRSAPQGSRSARSRLPVPRPAPPGHKGWPAGVRTRPPSARPSRLLLALVPPGTAAHGRQPAHPLAQPSQRAARPPQNAPAAAPVTAPARMVSCTLWKPLETACTSFTP